MTEKLTDANIKWITWQGRMMNIDEDKFFTNILKELLKPTEFKKQQFIVILHFILTFFHKNAMILINHK